ncbi:MAG: M14 metallopeptidase family protein [Chitinophagaceae bacterium]
MRKLVLISFALLATCLSPWAQDLHYYLPDSVTYDPSIPKPKDIIYHEVGEWHVTHDRLVNYMKAIAAAAPGRVKLETMGFTYENRPQVLLIITSPKNHQRLEEIRQQHLKLSDPAQSASINIDNMPIVVWIGHSIHGNEPSGANASLVSAYYLAAAQGKQIDELLDNTVILFDPSFNPDGLQRFSTWANQHKSKNLVSDPNSREFNEVWPGGRFNHYWFDLNRDWLPAVHIESQNRLEWFHKWKPNILTDHHEQGSNATFFFQPGVPSRVNPLTPAKNQELTAKLGKYHAQFLDRIGSLYFTKENYDDFYYGKGSTYPDINGAIGILFEQGSSRGHLMQTTNGLLSFPFTIRNQFVTALSTLEGAKTLRKEFLQWQKDFYKNSMVEAAADPVQAYVFAGDDMAEQLNDFITMLLRHGIHVHGLAKDITVNGYKYMKGINFVVPVQQPQYKLVKTIFERTNIYKDSLFYDITAWTMPLAYGIPSASLGKEVDKDLYYDSYYTYDKYKAGGGIHVSGFSGKNTPSNYGYLVSWDDLNAPAALYELLNAGLMAKVTTEPFRLPKEYPADEGTVFSRGSFFVPAQRQNLSPDSLYRLVKRLAEKYKVVSRAVETGLMAEGNDLGSSRFQPLTKPSIAMIVGPGVNATDAGEVWHLLDQRMNIPATHLEIAMFNRVSLNKYNTLVMVGGSYNDLNKEKLKTWVQDGGVLILTEEAVSWASQNGITDVKFKKAKAPTDSTQKLTYTDREQIEGAQQIQGAIFGADIDPTHPLSFGYNQKTISLFKANKVFMEKSRNPYATPFYYGANPLQSGWVSKENKDAIKNSAAVVVNTVGTGRVINIADNPNFRAFWLGGTKLFMNAIFFGRIIDSASARSGE